MVTAALDRVFRAGESATLGGDREGLALGTVLLWRPFLIWHAVASALLRAFLPLSLLVEPGLWPRFSETLGGIGGLAAACCLPECAAVAAALGRGPPLPGLTDLLSPLLGAGTGAVPAASHGAARSGGLPAGPSIAKHPVSHEYAATRWPRSHASRAPYVCLAGSHQVGFCLLFTSGDVTLFLPSDWSWECA